jgi:filamentous hemagglutinin
VKCWAEFSPNSDEWLANYVSPEQAAQLGPEMEWVQSQNTSAGLFDYTPLQRWWDTGTSQVDMAVRGATSVADQFGWLMIHNNGPQPLADANPLIDASNGGTGTPPSPAVVTPAFEACLPNGQCVVSPPMLMPGTPGYVPSTATLNNGDDHSSAGNSGTGSAYDRVYGGRTTVENVTSRGTSIETVPHGNDAMAASDFAALKPNMVRTVSTGRGDVSIGTFNDGSTVILRPSKEGRTTIEFQNSNGRTTKEIRYGSK